MAVGSGPLVGRVRVADVAMAAAFRRDNRRPFSIEDPDPLPSATLHPDIQVMRGAKLPPKRRAR